MNLFLIGCLNFAFCLGLWGMVVFAADPPGGSGAQFQVRTIEFKGVHALSEEQLKKIIDTRERRFIWFTDAPLDESVLMEDLERIMKYYRSEGFYHARVVSHEIVPIDGSRDVRITIEVEEGPAMTVSEVYLRVDGRSDGSLCEELRSLLPLKPRDRFTTGAYHDCESGVLDMLADRGYPKARVDLGAQLNKRANRAEVSMDVTTGPVCSFGPVTIEGNRRTEKEVILRELTFRRGERFDASKVAESQRKLFNLRLFMFVDVSVGNMEGDATELPVRILVKEAKKQTVRVGVGYGTEEKLRGKVQWEIRDFLGDGRRLQVNAKASSLGQVLEGNFLQPYFPDMRSSFTTDVGFAHEDEASFENRKFFITPRIKYNWTDRVTPYAGYSLEANRLLSIDPQKDVLTPLDRENEEYFVSSVVGGVSWDNVDDPVNTRRGFRLAQALEWAGIALGSEVDYIKLSLEGRGFLPVSDYGVLALRVKWGGITELENTRGIPIFKRFFAGGSNSVRGYPYERLGPLDGDGEPIGGLTLLEGNLDWRFPLPIWRKPIEGVLFFDWGNVYEDSYHILWDDLRYTAGCGVRYATPVGPLRLDLGYQLNPPDHQYFTHYQIHFSIGQAF